MLKCPRIKRIEKLRDLATQGVDSVFIRPEIVLLSRGTSTRETGLLVALYGAILGRIEINGVCVEYRGCMAA